LKSYLWQHFWDKYIRYLLTAGKFGQVLSLCHEGIKDNPLSEQTILSCIQNVENELSISNTGMIIAVIDYRIFQINQNPESLPPESSLIKNILHSYRYRFNIIMKKQKNTESEYNSKININNVSEMQQIKTLLLIHE
jgi:hypothetical protein